MDIYAIDHIQIAIPSEAEEQARDFYITILGFTEVPKPPALAGRGGLWLVQGTVSLHLGVDNEFHAARKAHPAFLVHDLDALITRSTAAGYRVSTNEPPLTGYRRAHVFDPFGNRIELMEKA